MDVANLVGSTPDGWWRDRVGATERTLGWLARLPGTDLQLAEDRLRVDAVTVVLEGKAAAAAVPEGLRVLRAGRGETGDEVIAGYAAEPGAPELLVVTADRGLRARLPDGVQVAGPGLLLAFRDRSQPR